MNRSIETSNLSNVIADHKQQTPGNVSLGKVMRPRDRIAGHRLPKRRGY